LIGVLFFHVVTMVIVVGVATGIGFTVLVRSTLDVFM